MKHYDIAIIGGGPAGLAAAIEAREKGVESIVVLERDVELGGILQQCIHNGFGLHFFKEDLTGPEYAQRFIDKLKGMGIEYKVNTMVLEITEDHRVNFMNDKDGFTWIQTKAIVLAMGCRERTRGSVNIPGSRPAGVYTAGTAQRLINIEGYLVGKRIMMLGTGDIGLIMARRLVLEGAEIRAVLARRNYPGGLMRNVAQCLDDFGIPMLLQHTIVKVLGKDRVEGVLVAKTDEKRQPIPESQELWECDALLLSLGLIPENELSKNIGIELDPKTKGPVVNESMETSVPGIFACGNVVHVHDLVDFVTDESKMAGESAARYVFDQVSGQGPVITTKAQRGITYIVPQRIRVGNVKDNVKLLMRVSEIFNNQRLSVKIDGVEIKNRRRPNMTPGEMEHIEIKPQLLEDAITKKESAVLSVEVVEAKR